MPGHGGARTGAGRKPAPIVEPAPIMALLDHLERMPGGDAGRQSRCAVALASYGATDAEIAASLGLSVGHVEAFLGSDVAVGRTLARLNIRSELMRAAKGDGRAFSAAAANTVLRWLAPPDARGSRL